jgi:hypothetical protein
MARKGEKALNMGFASPRRCFGANDLKGIDFYEGHNCKRIYECARRSLHCLFHVMPFWMAGSAGLNLMLLLPFEQMNKSALNLPAKSPSLSKSSLWFFRSSVQYPPITGLCKVEAGVVPVDWRVQEHW